MTVPTESSWAATELGRRKIPDPMMVPTTTATASKRFSSFLRAGGEAATSPAEDSEKPFD
jgi:hypothetical protein